MTIMVTLIRHGITQGNLERRYIGVTDQPLAKEGIAQLEEYSARGIYPKADFVASSPMQRAERSAEIIYPTVPKKYYEEISEHDFGEFEGKNYEELKANPDYHIWIDSDGESDVHGGETMEAFKRRCLVGFLGIIKDALEAGKQNVAVVTHGGVIMCIMEQFAVPNKGFYHWQAKNGRGYSFNFIVDKNIAIRVEEV